MAKATEDDTLDLSSLLDLNLPTELGAVAPFIEQAIMVIEVQPDDPAKLRAGYYCLEHAIRLSATVLQEFDGPDEARDAARQAVQQIRACADMVMAAAEHSKRADQPILASPGMAEESHLAGFEAIPKPESSTARKVFDTLAPAALEMMDQADSHQLRGERSEAAREFHAATIFFRILQSVEALHQRLQDKVNYALWRAKTNSHLIENCVPEHLLDNVRLDDVYTVHRDAPLGKGSYGSVVRVTHKRSGQVYACKALLVKRLTHHYVRKIHEEISILKEMDHPNIARLREVFFDRKYIYLVQDLCEGGELYEVLAKNPGKGCGEEETAKMLLDMLSAVRYLHEHGVVHRDLKLENFLLDRPMDESGNMDDSHLKLIDFGLSKHFKTNEAMNHVVGSAYYIAPEVLEGEYDSKCDIWSLGVIAYMLLSGAPPFWGNTEEEIHNHILTGTLKFPKKLFRRVSDEAVDIVCQLLTKDATQRPSAEEAMLHPFIQRYLNPEEKAAPGGGRRLRGMFRNSDADAADADADAAKSDVGDVEEDPAQVALAESLREFRGFTQFKKVMLEVVAFSLSPQQIGRLRETFQAIDKDRNGTISLAELQQALHDVDGVSQDEVRRIFEDMDVDHDASLNYTEFIAATMYRRVDIDEDRLQQVFETLDTDKVGYLSTENLRSVLGQDMDEESINRMLAEADKNDDGRIDYSEFSAMWFENAVEQHVTPLERLAKSAKRMSLLVRHVRTFKSMIGGGLHHDATATDPQLDTALAAAREAATEGESTDTAKAGTRHDDDHEDDPRAVAAQRSRSGDSSAAQSKPAVSTDATKKADDSGSASASVASTSSTQRSQGGDEKGTGDGSEPKDGKKRGFMSKLLNR